ncbi:hypothetical protein TrRE_jg547, partial [Triparma retinervis]
MDEYCDFPSQASNVEEELGKLMAEDENLCPGINACMVCGKKKINFPCPKCKLVTYCSEACRKVDSCIPASSPTPGHCVEVCDALKSVASSSEEADRSELE